MVRTALDLADKVVDLIIEEDFPGAAANMNVLGQMWHDIYGFDGLEKWVYICHYMEDRAHLLTDDLDLLDRWFAYDPVVH